VSRQAVNNWESGYRRIPEMAAKLLRTLKEQEDGQSNPGSDGASYSIPVER